MQPWDGAIWAIYSRTYEPRCGFPFISEPIIMTARRPSRHVAPVEDPPTAQSVPPAAETAGSRPAGAKRWLITAGGVAAPGAPAAVLTMTSRTVAQPMLITVVLLAAIIIVSSAAAVIYQARQETRRKQIDLQPVTTVAHALAACIDDAHQHAENPTDKASVAEAQRVRDSALQYLAEHGTDILTRLTERPNS